MTQYRRWIEDYDTVAQWIGQYDLRSLLQQSPGLLRIPNFLPDFVAQGLLTQLESLPDKHWALQHSSPDYVATNISHRFNSSQVHVLIAVR